MSLNDTHTLKKKTRLRKPEQETKRKKLVCVNPSRKQTMMQHSQHTKGTAPAEHYHQMDGRLRKCKFGTRCWKRECTTLQTAQNHAAPPQRRSPARRGHWSTPRERRDELARPAKNTQARPGNWTPAPAKHQEPARPLSKDAAQAPKRRRVVQRTTKGEIEDMVRSVVREELARALGKNRSANRSGSRGRCTERSSNQERSADRKNSPKRKASRSNSSRQSISAPTAKSRPSESDAKSEKSESGRVTDVEVTDSATESESAVE